MCVGPVAYEQALFILTPTLSLNGEGVGVR